MTENSKTKPSIFWGKLPCFLGIQVMTWYPFPMWHLVKNGAFHPFFPWSFHDLQSWGIHKLQWTWATPTKTARLWGWKNKPFLFDPGVHSASSYHDHIIILSSYYHHHIIISLSKSSTWQIIMDLLFKLVWCSVIRTQPLQACTTTNFLFWEMIDTSKWVGGAINSWNILEYII